MLEKGKHHVTVKNCGFTPGKDGKAPQLSVHFEDENGEGITWYTSLGLVKDGTFSAKGFDYAVKQLAGLGWDAEANAYQFEALASPEQSPIFGVEAVIVVVDELYEGKTTTKVKWINDPNRPTPGMERMDAASAREFGDKVRLALAGEGRNVPAVSRRPLPMREPQVDEFPPTTLEKAKAAGVSAGPAEFDDIPF